MHNSRNDRTRLLAAQQRVTPLAPRVCVMREDDRLTVLTDCGFGLSTCAGERLYGDTADTLSAPSGVRVWVQEGNRRIYTAPMVDYARSEQEYLRGDRRVTVSEHSVTFWVRRADIEMTERAYLDGRDEVRALTVRNIAPYPRELMVCACVTPAFAGDSAYTDGGVLYRNARCKLGIRFVPTQDDAKYSGGKRLRVRKRLWLPAGGEWCGTLAITAAAVAAAPVIPHTYERMVPSDALLLGARLYPVRRPLPCGEDTERLPTVPFVYVELHRGTDLPLLTGYLSRLSRWQAEGIAAGVAVAYAPPLCTAVKQQLAQYAQVPAVSALLDEAPAKWKQLCFADTRTLRRLHRSLAVAYTPLPRLYPPRHRADTEMTAVMRYRERLYILPADTTLTAPFPVTVTAAPQEWCVTVQPPTAESVTVALVRRCDSALSPYVWEWQWDGERLVYWDVTGAHPLTVMTAQGGDMVPLTDCAELWGGGWQYPAVGLSPHPIMGIAVTIHASSPSRCAVWRFEENGL